jgi:hypothetical protein
MVIPTVDEVWADFNVDGSVHEPVKQDIRRLLRFIQAIGETNGMKTYPTAAAMNADLTQPDGQAALIYADPTATNNYPTVWTWNDAGNIWVAGVDRISSLGTAVTLIQSIMRRVVVLAGEITIDRINMLGGGTNQMYVPQNVFIDVPSASASNLTILPASTELAGTVKIAIPQGIRCFAYLDLTNNSYNIIQATGGDFTLPGLNIDKIVPLIVFPATNGRYASPFKVRELSPPEKGTSFLPLRPIVHSRAEDKVLIPGGSYRSASSSVVTHTVAGGAAYEEFSLSSSASNPITYWFNIKTNAYVATAAAAEPFNIDPTFGIVLGYSFGSEFWSPWPHVGMMGEGVGLNSFNLSKLPSQAPKVQIASNAHIVVITEPNLLALGFTEGMANNNSSSPLPAYGDYLPDTRWPARAFFRTWIQTSVDDDFGTPRIWFVKEPEFGSASNSFPLSLEKKLSSKAAIYSAAFTIPNPALATNPNGPWSYWFGGTGGVAATADRYAVTGNQFDNLTPGVKWLERNDFPTIQNTPNRVKSLEGQVTSAIADPDPKSLMPGAIYLADGRPQSLYHDGMFEVRVADVKFRATLMSVGDADDMASAGTTGKPTYTHPVPPLGALEVRADNLGPAGRVVARKNSDNAIGAVRPNRHFVSDWFEVRKAAADQRVAGSPPTARPLTFLGIGDSLNGNTHHIILKAILEDMGFDANFVGTIGASFGALNEGRGGGSGQALIGKFTGGGVGEIVIAPGAPAWAAYMALGEDPAVSPNKLQFNPVLRAATGGDPAGRIFNGNIIDFQNYLTRSAQPEPDVFMFGLGTGDINHNLTNPAQAVDDILQWLEVVYGTIRDQFGTNKDMMFWMPALPRGNGSGQDASETRWPTLQVPVIKAMIDWARDKADDHLAFVPAYLFLDPVAPWYGNGVPGKEVIISTDPLTGAMDVDWLDNIHYDNYGRHQVSEQLAAAIAWHLGVRLS